MRGFSLDAVWEIDSDIEFPEESDFVEVPPNVLTLKDSKFFSSDLVLGEMGAYWYLTHRYFPDIQTPVLTLDQLDAIAEGRFMTFAENLKLWEEQDNG